MNTFKKAGEPCERCGKALRKLSHYGPWVAEGMHIKCWKEKQSKAVDEAYRKTQQDREALFQRAVDGDETLEVPE